MWRMNRDKYFFFMDADAGGDTGSEVGDGVGETGESVGDSTDTTGETTAEVQIPTYLSQGSPEVREKYADYFKAYPKFNDVLLAHVKAKDDLKRSIVVPDKENATPEEISAFYKKMDIPESAEGYAIEVDDKVPEMGALAKLVTDKALTAGLTKSQGKAMWETISSVVNEGIATKAATNKAAEEALPAELLKLHKGEEAESTEAYNRFQAFLVRLGSKEIAADLAETGLMYKPAFVDRIAQLEKELGDDTFVESIARKKHVTKSPGKMGSYSAEFLAMAGEGDK